MSGLGSRIRVFPLSGLPPVRIPSKSVEVQRVWEVYDERLQFMSRHDAVQLDESLGAGDVSRAWLVWPGAAEAALVDAYQFCGVLSQPEVWFLGGRVLCLGSSGFWRSQGAEGSR